MEAADPIKIALAEDRLIWEISAAVAPRSIETLFAPISFKIDRNKRRATVWIPVIGRDQY
jgi:hypothetical protein